MADCRNITPRYAFKYDRADNQSDLHALALDVLETEARWMASVPPGVELPENEEFWAFIQAQEAFLLHQCRTPEEAVLKVRLTLANSLLVNVVDTYRYPDLDTSKTKSIEVFLKTLIAANGLFASGQRKKSRS